MNIFVVDRDPFKSAVQLHDKHVVKMILESTQMLANAVGSSYGISATYLFTKRFNTTPFHLAIATKGLTALLLMEQMVNGRTKGWDPLGRVQYSDKGYYKHPCTVWVRENVDNLHWLVCHGLGLCQEYTRRYNKTHACQKELKYLYQVLQLHGIFGEWRNVKTFARAMPEELKFDESIDDVTAYRRYLSEHKPFYQKTWKRSEKPSWV